ncbi:MAG: type II toxin-antitoxin system death-on-curing family toxin [Candidatus Paceibacterota bacterium]
MSNDEIFYPDRDIIELWVKFLKNENNDLKLKLPQIDSLWFEKVLDTIERVKMPYSVGIHSKVAHLFYYLDKDHNFLDGNKRTTIIITYLFYAMNGYRILNAERVKKLAKKLAKSHGSRNKEEWMQKIEKELTILIELI